MTYNNGVYVKGSTSSDFEVDYYKKLEKVIELQYHSKYNRVFYSNVIGITDTTKRLMSSPKCRSIEVINNPARLVSNHREVNCINYK